MELEVVGVNEGGQKDAAGGHTRSASSGRGGCGLAAGCIQCAGGIERLAVARPVDGGTN
jgi:hypothetical protein